MQKIKKLLFIFFFIISFALILSSFSFAQEGKPLEIKYPEAFGKAPLTTKTGLPEYVKYIFNFSIMIGGLIAFGALVYGGFRYLTSAGSPAAIADAKDQILAAFLGLIILLCSYLILATINLQLTVIEVTKPKPGEILIGPLSSLGVYLFKEDYKTGEKCVPEIEKGNCLRIIGDVSDLGVYGFNDNAKKIKFTNSETNKFGTILHEDPDFKDNCRIFFEDPGVEFQSVLGKTNLGEVKKPSSATIFREGEEGAGGYVAIYSDPEFGGSSKTYDNSVRSPETVGGLENNVRSIKIEGKFLVVLFENPPGGSFPGKCEVFRKSDSDLKNNPIGRCGTIEWKFGFIPWYTFKSCVSAIVIYPIR